MRKRFVLLALCLLLLTAGCAFHPISTKYRYDKRVDFATLRTFDWLPVPSEATEERLNMKEVEETVRAALEIKGIKLNPSSPDFLIALHGGIEERVDYKNWGYAPPSDGVWDSYGRFSSIRYQPTIKKIVYVKGKLMLDFVDSETKDLIWRGTLSATLDPKESRAERTGRMKEAVGKVLKNFPPPQKKERGETTEQPPSD